MREEKYYIVILESKNHAVQLIYILENLGYKRFRLISAPCQIRTGCDFGIEFKNLGDLKIIKNETNRLNTKIKGVYSIERKNKKKIIRKLNHLI